MKKHLRWLLYWRQSIKAPPPKPFLISFFNANYMQRWKIPMVANPDAREGNPGTREGNLGTREEKPGTRENDFV
jgi:hypothetical protein